MSHASSISPSRTRQTTRKSICRSTGLPGGRDLDRRVAHDELLAERDEGDEDDREAAGAARSEPLEECPQTASRGRTARRLPRSGERSVPGSPREPSFRLCSSVSALAAAATDSRRGSGELGGDVPGPSLDGRPVQMVTCTSAAEPVDQSASQRNSRHLHDAAEHPMAPRRETGGGTAARRVGPRGPSRPG